MKDIVDAYNADKEQVYVKTVVDAIYTSENENENLKDKLINIVNNISENNAQLSESVQQISDTKIDIKSLGINKANKDEIFTMANMGQDIKTAMTGGSVPVVGVNAVQNQNIQANAVQPRNIKGHSIINLLDINEIEIGEINSSGVIDGSKTLYRVSPFIPVTIGDTISFSGRYQNFRTQVVIFNSNKEVIGYKNFIDNDGDSNTWGTLSPLTMKEASCCYVRFNYSSAIEKPYCYLSSTLPDTFFSYGEASIDWLKVKKENLSLNDGDIELTKVKINNNDIDLSKLNLKHENQLYLTNSIKFKRSTSHIYISDLLYKINGNYKTVKATDFPNQHPTGEFRFWVNNLSTLYFDSEEANKGNYPFIWKTLGETVHQVGNRYQTIVIVKDNGIISNYSVEYIDEDNASFDINNSQLLISNKLFLLEGETLPIYKNSIILDPAEGRKITMMFKSDKSYSDGYYEYIEPKITVDSSRVGVDGFIGILPNMVTWSTGYYGKNIEIVNKKKSQITNITPSILFFGDSLTAKGTPSKTKDYLTGYGINANMLGTVKDDYNTNCEGRGSRTFAQYIGYRSLETTDDVTPTPIYPFLKIASEEDKQNHPMWCFTRTNNVREQNYKEATDKSQNFYIFDFYHYLSSQGYSSPDVVIISLSTNDFWKYDEVEATKICKLAYDIMISQILVACPDCKIGIIPHPAYATTRGNKNVTSNWNLVAQDYIYNMHNENIDIIGAWMSQSSDMSFNMVEYEQITSDGICALNQPDTIHPKPWGIKEVSKSIAFYIVNQL